MKRLFRALLLLFLLWIFFLMGSIFSYAYASDPLPADAAVVLGAAVFRERPSPVFAERINHAIALYESGQVEALIFTGGVGTRDDLAESEAARLYAIRQVWRFKVFARAFRVKSLSNFRVFAPWFHSFCADPFSVSKFLRRSFIRKVAHPCARRVRFEAISPASSSRGW